MACFLGNWLLTVADPFTLMFQRRVAELWSQCADGVTAAVDRAQQYRLLVQGLAAQKDVAVASERWFR